MDYVQMQHGGSGIVYCHKKATVEQVTQALLSNGIKAAAFHGSVKASSKDAALRSWLRGGKPGDEANNAIQVMVATVAFGMGVDKPNVRFVIHYDMPKSPAALIQESGRAGRDRLPAQSRVYYDPEDLSMFQFLASTNAAQGAARAGHNPERQLQDQLDRLQRIGDWCDLEPPPPPPPSSSSSSEGPGDYGYSQRKGRKNGDQATNRSAFLR